MSQFLQKLEVYYSEFVTQNLHNAPPGCGIAGTVLQISLMTEYHIVDQVDQVYLLINLLYTRGQCCRYSFKEMSSLIRFLLLSFSELNFNVVPWSSIYGLRVESGLNVFLVNI